MEPESSLMRSDEPVTGPYADPDDSPHSVLSNGKRNAKCFA
jgi:hypothetical protein